MPTPDTTPAAGTGGAAAFKPLAYDLAEKSRQLGYNQAQRDAGIEEDFSTTIADRDAAFCNLLAAASHPIAPAPDAVAERNLQAAHRLQDKLAREQAVYLADATALDLVRDALADPIASPASAAAGGGVPTVEAVQSVDPAPNGDHVAAVLKAYPDARSHKFGPGGKWPNGEWAILTGIGDTLKAAGRGHTAAEAWERAAALARLAQPRPAAAVGSDVADLKAIAHRFIQEGNRRVKEGSHLPQWIVDAMRGMWNAMAWAEDVADARVGAGAVREAARAIGHYKDAVDTFIAFIPEYVTADSYQAEETHYRSEIVDASLTLHARLAALDAALAEAGPDVEGWLAIRTLRAHFGPVWIGWDGTSDAGEPGIRNGDAHGVMESIRGNTNYRPTHWQPCPDRSRKPAPPTPAQSDRSAT